MSGGARSAWHSWWERRYGAEGNLISGNRIQDVENGVWIGSRMAQNQYFMDRSDPAYISIPLVRIFLDYAAENVVSDNFFYAVDYGVRIEDDSSLIEGNQFVSTDPHDQAVVLGTMFRTYKLRHPVRGSSIIGNQADIYRNPSPYFWIHGQEDTLFSDNTAHGRPVSLRRGKQPSMDLHLFVDEVWYEASEGQNASYSRGSAAYGRASGSSGGPSLPIGPVPHP